MVQTAESRKQGCHSAAGQKDPVDGPLKHGYLLIQIFGDALPLRHNQKFPVGLRARGKHDISTFIIVRVETRRVLQLQRAIQDQLPIRIRGAGIRRRALLLGCRSRISRRRVGLGRIAALPAAAGQRRQRQSHRQYKCHPSFSLCFHCLPPHSRIENTKAAPLRRAARPYFHAKITVPAPKSRGRTRHTPSSRSSDSRVGRAPGSPASLFCLPSFPVTDLRRGTKTPRLQRRFR